MMYLDIDALMAILKQRGMSLGHLSTLLGKSKSYMGVILMQARKNHRFTLNTMRAIAKILDVNVRDIVSNSDSVMGRLEQE